MTSRETNSGDDAEFELFLQRKGELAQHLQALDQPEPSAELDAAILAKAEEQELAMAKRLSRNASNDSAVPDPVVSRPSFLGRWRMPIGLAASVVLGLFIVLQSQRETEIGAPMQVAQAPLPQEAAPSNMRSTDAGQPSAAQPAPPAERKAPTSRQKSMAKEPPAPPVMVAQADSDAANGTVWRSAPSPVAAGQPESGSNDAPKLWLALIEELLKADMRRDALEEWKNFRKVHPQYPVPDKLLKELEPQTSK